MSDELLPIRCVTCNKILGDKYSRYTEMIESGMSIEETLDNLGLNRYCCRLRVRNPFKVVNRFDDFEILSVDSKNEASTEGALSSMNSSSFTIVPEEEEISLPSVPKISLPPVSKGKEINRTYKAW